MTADPTPMAMATIFGVILPGAIYAAGSVTFPTSERRVAFVVIDPNKVICCRFGAKYVQFFIYKIYKMCVVKCVKVSIQDFCCSIFF